MTTEERPVMTFVSIDATITSPDVTRVTLVLDVRSNGTHGGMWEAERAVKAVARLFDRREAADA